MPEETDHEATEEMSQGSDYSSVIININRLFEESSSNPPSKPIIFKVDARLRKVNQKDYEPKKVSIGPIHHGKEQVKSMEEHKVRLLKELLAKRTDLCLENLVKEVSKVEEYARKCYSKYSTLGKEINFLEILLLDGCFIIQLMRLYSFAKHCGDPVLESWKLNQIIDDILLFENQIPFRVLTTLFNKIKTGNPTDDLSYLILNLVGDIVPWLDRSKANLLPEPNHLLEFVYRCISTKMPPNPNPNSDSDSNESPVNSISSASELKEVAGIHLRMSKDKILTFAGRVLRCPPLEVSNETKSLLRNLMAYEQLQLPGDKQRHVIDYVFFVHCLAKSTKDIEIMRYHEIIENNLGGDDQIVKMIGQLGTHFMISPHYTYSDTFESLNKLCSNRRNTLMANLKRTYFNTPWSAIQFVAATLLLVFAAAQVVFAVLSYSTQMSTNKN